MVRSSNPQEGVFAGVSIGYSANTIKQSVTPHHRPGGDGDPYGGWKGLSSHDGLDAVYVDGGKVPHGESMFLEAGDGEGLEVEVEENGAGERFAVVTTVDMTDEELEEERERLVAEDEAWQEENSYHPLKGR